MAIAHFPSFDDGDALDVGFLKPQGGELTLRLLVDSGFTGQSCFVLPVNANGLAHAAVPSAEVAGALQGVQKRVVVSCRIADLSFAVAAIAIIADTSGLALPVGVQGIVGLRFLRHFRRWGAEQTAVGAWRFFLETDTA
ncbi:MAG: hypothetical protein EXR98_06735 [Gemmataceae bacterium]|nr:hypothetical protein [Gemmataceae bacterium]